MGTWGPTPTANWTLIAFLTVDQPVNDFGSTVAGRGTPIKILSCGAAGGTTIDMYVPSTGNIPSEQKRARGSRALVCRRRHPCTGIGNPHHEIVMAPGFGAP